LYTFSLENFKRSPIEQQFLFKLLVEEAEKGINEFIENEIRIQFIGDRSLFPQEVIPACQMIEEKTAHLSKLTLNFLFCYGARQEIVNSIKTVIADVQTGKLQIQELTEESFQHYLWTGTMPEPDLIIRTGGFKRLSNFLLYQAAYSEFYFLDCLWPELTIEHLQTAVTEFVACRRNFGT
jgi:undecaprenyl diphosphate synthase